MFSFILFIVAALLIAGLIILLNKKNKIEIDDSESSAIKSALQNSISFYQKLNTTEFFAVIAEYLFEKPLMLEKEHPEIYRLLKKMFTPKST